MRGNEEKPQRRSLYYKLCVFIPDLVMLGFHKVLWKNNVVLCVTYEKRVFPDSNRECDPKETPLCFNQSRLRRRLQRRAVCQTPMKARSAHLIPRGVPFLSLRERWRIKSSKCDSGLDVQKRSFGSLLSKLADPILYSKVCSSIHDS